MEFSIAYLALLACPVGMGLMMWFMMRGNKSGDQRGAHAGASADDLRAERHAIDAEIERREQADVRVGRV